MNTRTPFTMLTRMREADVRDYETGKLSWGELKELLLKRDEITEEEVKMFEKRVRYGL